ncbi:MAG: hypothetical protein PQJ44_07915 [Sphaerochaetaceae bacterium]|nr:hypothetical protein [Sphaerochaetaceae bacterium]
MNLDNYNVKEKLNIAIETHDVNLLTLLMGEKNMIIRRAVARNINTPSSVLNILAYDKVLNVVYQALKNPNCTVKRKIKDINHPCITCNLRGDEMDCSNCVNLKKYKLEKC